MLRALELAQNGTGNVAPNPLVGCVIVLNDKIIGEGWHQKHGKAHAEVIAIESVDNKELLKQATLYVTLEPCSHYGKTPPCVDLIIKYNIPKVVICNIDPFEKVNGTGIKKLKNQGIEVISGVLEDKGRNLNKRFFTFLEKERPYVILKWAQTNNGFIAKKDFDSKWISNETSRKIVHKMRAEEAAILVGYNTAKHDNPSLTTRDWIGKNPIRVYIDKNLSLPTTIHLVDKSTSTLCYNSSKKEVLENFEFVKIASQDLTRNLLNDLYKRGIHSVIIEGGSATIQAFIDDGLWDEAYIFESDNVFKKGITAPHLSSTTYTEETIINNRLKIYKNV